MGVGRERKRMWGTRRGLLQKDESDGKETSDVMEGEGAVSSLLR